MSSNVGAPLKGGLDYFSLDVDMDHNDKIVFVEAKHGPIAFSVIIKILMRIYQKGYYYRWGEHEQILFAGRTLIPINVVNNVINDCINEGLFDINVYKKYGILTSKEIQKRYLLACSRRKVVKFCTAYTLIPINDYINSENVTLIQLMPSINTQSKVKESKRKESNKEKDTPPKNKFLGNVLLTNDEHEKLIIDYGKETIGDYIQRLDEYIGSMGYQKKYKNHNMTLRSWLRRDGINPSDNGDSRALVLMKHSDQEMYDKYDTMGFDHADAQMWESWEPAKAQLKNELNQESYKCFIEPLRIVTVDNGTMVLAIRGGSVQWVIDNFKETILKATQKENDKVKAVKIITDMSEEVEK